MLKRYLRQAATAVTAASFALGLPLAAPAGADVPTFADTLAGPSVASMYPSGFEYDEANDRIVVADTGLDRIRFYDLNGTQLGSFGESGSGLDQFDSPRDVAIGEDGSIYVADAGNNRVHKYTSAGVRLLSIGGTGTCPTCLNTPIGVTWDAINDQVLVASTGQHLVKAYDAAFNHVWTSPASATIGVVAPRDVSRGPDGRLWITAYKPGGSGSGITGHQIKVYDVTANGVFASNIPVFVLGSPTGATGNTPAVFNFPYNVDFSPDATRAYVSDTGNARISVWNISVTPPVHVKNVGSRCPFPCDEGPTDQQPGQFEHLRRVAVTDEGLVLGADFWGSGINVFGAAPDNTIVRLIDGAPAAAPGVAQAWGVDVGPDGTTYVVDRLNQRIERFAADGTYLNKAGARGTGPARFSWPEAVAVAPNGEVWVADTRNDRIHRFPANLATTPNVPNYGFSTAGVASAGEFNWIEDIDVAPNGIVWIADTRNNRLQTFDPTTTTFSLFSTAVALNEPRGLAVGDDEVYVADALNNRILKLGYDGALQATFATGLSEPDGVELAGDGTVWVADTDNHRVLHLSADLVDLGDTFGSLGTGNLEFDRPHTLAAFEDKLFVADTFNSRVQIFDLDGTPPPDVFEPEYFDELSDPGGVAPLYPAGGASDPAGNLYVADSGGSRVVKIDTGGVQTTIASAGLNDPRDIEFDSAGVDLWVLDTGNDRVVRMSTTGAISSSFTGLTDPYGLSNDANGLYVADTYAVPARVVKLDKTTGAVAWSQAACNSVAFLRPRDVGMGPDGNVYVADTDNNRVARLDPATGACVGSPFGTTGTANGQLKAPRSVVTNKLTNANAGVWVADAGNNRLQNFRTNGTFISKTAPAGGNFGQNAGQYRSAHCVFQKPSTGPVPWQLHACDTFNYRIQRYNVGTGGFATLQGPPVGGVRPSDGGFNGAFDAVYGPDGSIYAADWFNHRIQKFNPDGSFNSAWGGYGTPGGSFIFPRGVAINPAGNELIVTNSENNRIDRFSFTGTFLGSIKPPAASALSRPHQTAPAPDGTFWVADTNKNRVVHLSATGAVLHSWGVGTPRGIALGPDGNVYVSTGNMVQKRLSTSGAVLATIAGNGTGPGQVKTPYGLRIVGAPGDEMLLIADAGNNRVNVKRLDGTAVLTFGGLGTGDGQFQSPRGVAMNPATGDLVVADFTNNRLSLWHS